MLKVKNVAEKIAEIIGDRIIRMTYEPGMRITELQVAAEMGVSQSSVREALKTLQQHGLVAINPRRGTFVTPLTRVDVIVLYDMIAGLYAVLIRHFVPVCTPDAVARVDAVLERLRTAARQADAEMYYSAIFAFANVAVDALDSELLRKTIHDLWFNKRRVEYRLLTSRRHDLGDNLVYFERMTAHVRNGDATGAIDVLAQYIDAEKTAALAYFSD